jgi:hypothetical protein
MLALNVLCQYLKFHVLIVLATDSKYAQRLIGIQNPRNERGPVHTARVATRRPLRLSLVRESGGAYQGLGKDWSTPL